MRLKKRDYKTGIKLRVKSASVMRPAEGPAAVLLSVLCENKQKIFGVQTVVTKIRCLKM